MSANNSHSDDSATGTAGSSRRSSLASEIERRSGKASDFYELESNAPHCVLPPNFFDRLLAKRSGTMRASTQYVIARQMMDAAG